MEDLQYIVGIGFSGADLPRAVILAFFFAMFAKRDTNVWIYTMFALVIDRAIWPIAAMGAAGADVQTMSASVSAMGKSFVDDLGIYIVRYLGLAFMMSAFIWFRARVWRIVPGSGAAPA